jgi:hypothetical protein
MDETIFPKNEGADFEFKLTLYQVLRFISKCN